AGHTKADHRFKHSTLGTHARIFDTARNIIGDLYQSQIRIPLPDRFIVRLYLVKW
ncbi:MAG: hypothetical protein ACJAXU_001038, partial [Paracoccaceae bacterium]